jgi:hypothetical protein
MDLNTELHLQYARDRRQRLLAEATAHRLARPTPLRTRLARLLRPAADRLDTAVAGGRTRELPERG